MTAGGADFAPVRFSSEDLPEGDRIQVWREFYGRSVFHTEIEPAPDVPFHAEVTVRSAPGLDLVFSAMSPVHLSRPPALVADGSDDINFFVSSSGGTVSQCGREITFDAGKAVVMTAAETASCTVPFNARYRCFHIRRTALAPFVADLDDTAQLRSIPPDNGALQYLLSYARFLEHNETLTAPDVVQTAAVHLRDLVALVLGATGDGAALAKTRGLPAAQFEAIKADITANLARRDLSLQFISRRQQISPRHIRRLFKAEGTTFSDFVLEQRLARARRMLGDPRYGEWTISAIAYAAGFGDLSYFNRAFRARFGVTPSGLRSMN